MSISISICKKQGWLYHGDRANIKSLIYPPKECPAKWSGNSNAISEFEREICDGVFVPKELADPLYPEKDHDLVLGQTDRYGLPVRTVLNMKTGLLRTDPYFKEIDLATFYSRHYRSIYTWQGIGMQEMRAHQINRGKRIMELVDQFKIQTGTILDIGCGLGATLLPFREAGWKTKGVDYGVDLIEEGKKSGLDLSVGSYDDLSSNFHCDLIILSHVLEHQRDPINFLKNIVNRWPSALLYIEVPGVLNIHNAYGGNILMYLQNAHTFHFCKTSLCRIAQIAGYGCLEADESVRGLFKFGKQSCISCEPNAKEILRYLKRIESGNKKRLMGTMRKIARRIKTAFRL